MDPRVQETQVWLNSTYGNNTNFVAVDEDGVTGYKTCKALIRALQIELNVSPVDGVWGDDTASAFTSLSVNSDSSNASIQRQIYILQGGFYCKGIDPGGFNGIFNESTQAAVQTLEARAGLATQTGVASAMIMKALLNTDAYTLLSNGDSNIRTIQQALNNNYSSYIGLIPCDGIFSRVTSRALISGLQVEQKKEYPNNVVDGVWGTTTMNRCPTLQRYGAGSNKQYVYLLQYALYVNGYDPNGFDGGFGAGVQSAVKRFQAFMELTADGIVGKQTWAALLVSYGDRDRSCTGADCMTPLTAATAALLVEKGRTAIGRYLTGGANKRLTIEELRIIRDAGLKLIPIYQTTGRAASYFTESRGRLDAYYAYQAYKNLRLPDGGTVYFAVDYDALTTDIDDYIIPYFQAVRARLLALGNNSFSVGIYAPRYVCTRLRQAGLTTSSFVCDMSSGFSCNIGYPLPNDWTFDQIKTTEISNDYWSLEVDNDVISSRDTSINVNPDDETNDDTPNITLNEYNFIDAVASCFGCKPNFLQEEFAFKQEYPVFTSPALDMYFTVYERISDVETATTGTVVMEVSNGALSEAFSAKLGPITLSLPLIKEGGLSLSDLAVAVKNGNISMSAQAIIVNGRPAANIRITASSDTTTIEAAGISMAVSVRLVIKSGEDYATSVAVNDSALQRLYQGLYEKATNLAIDIAEGISGTDNDSIPVALKFVLMLLVVLLSILCTAATAAVTGVSVALDALYDDANGLYSEAENTYQE